MRSLTPLRWLKIQGIRIRWRVCPQLFHENQWQNKYVESTLVLCLDGGSSPPISTNKIDNQSITNVVFILLYQSILNFGGGAVMSWSVRIVGVFLGMVCVGQNVMRLYDIPMPM